MSTFKSNMDAMFAKIFPAAAEAAQEDHGGFNIGDLVVIILDLVLLIYTGYRSWHFLSGSVSSDFQILALVGLWGLDIGMVAWSLVWIFGSATRFQNWASMGLFVIDMIGMFLTSIVDTLAYGNGDALPPIMKSVAWYGIPIIIGLNVLAGFVYHMTSPSTRKRRAERAQDEEMSKQQEKGDLELRRMTMQLQQAQDYTNKRATMLVSFADIAEQNIAMSEIEAQMMARLNKAASGQLGNLMNATGLNMPGVNLSQPNKPGIMDKLKELKDKFMPNDDEAESNTQQPTPLPVLQPIPTPAGFGGNGNGSNVAPLSRTMNRLFSLDLDVVKQIKLPNAIQVQRRGARRLPNPREALAMVLGALGTLNRSSGVQTLNAEVNGKPVALAMIEGAQFGEDTEGNTTLNEIASPVVTEEAT